MADGVGEQVVQHLGDALAVDHDMGQVARQVDMHGVAGVCAQERGSGLVDERRELGWRGIYGQGAGFDASDVEQIADESAHLVGLLVDDAEELAQLRPVEFARGGQHGGGGALDRSERGAQFVAYRAQELGALSFELVERLEVLHGDDHRFDGVAVGSGNRCCIEEGRDASAVRDGQNDLFGAHGLAACQSLCQGKLVEADLASVGPSVGDDLCQLLERAARYAQALDNARCLPVHERWPAGGGIEHYNADGRSLDQCLQACPCALLVSIRARVGDRRGRYRGKHHQHFLVIGGERFRALFLGKKEDADEGIAVSDRHALQSPRAHEMWREAERADISGQVVEPQRAGLVEKVFKETSGVGPRRQLVLLLGREAGVDDLERPAGVVDGGNDAVARAGQTPGTLYYLPEHGFDVEALGDA